MSYHSLLLSKLLTKFELSKSSPAIDAGTAKYAEVLKIPTRAYNGSAPDLGAKEITKRP